MNAELARTLPTHMRPSQLLVLDAFPLNANGKVDRARLPQRSTAVAAATTAVAANGAEATLGDIFARVLGLGTIAADTNFFDLGATSLKLVEAHAAVERTWPGTDVMALFEHPTIRDLARAIEARGAVVQNAGQLRGQQQAEALKRLQRARAAR